MREEYTQDWKLYLKGKSYNDELSPPYYQTININNSMYIGDQWKGVKANGLPTPVFNIFKRVINHMIASITSQDVSMSIVSEEIDDNKMIGDMKMDEMTDVLTSYFGRLWEDSKMSQKVRELLLDGALTGDYAVYCRWDEDRKTGIKRGIDPNTGLPVEVLGEINNDIIDSVNVFFGNPNDKRVNENGKPVQPYIIIAFREMTSKLKEEAKKYKSPDWDKIEPDTDNEYQAGDRSKQELEGDSESGKTTAIIKFYPKDGMIYARKSTKNAVVRKEFNTKRTLYPIAWANWDSIKNSYHGQALGTGLVPNQLFINKLFAMAMVSVMNTAYPKAVYDSSRIAGWSNAVGAAIPVEGDISNVAKYMEGANMSAQVMQLIEQTIAYTKDMLGASDAAMGDVKPDNTSAIIAVQQAAAIPLETIKLNLYQFAEDLGYIWLDSMIAYYGERQITTEVMGNKITKTIDFEQLRNMRIKLKIDVGASAYWSQITSVQTLDNLLKSDKISFLQYLDRLPDGFINKKQELIREIEEQQATQANSPNAEQVMQFIQTLPNDVQQELMNMDEQLRYQTAVKLMQKGAM